jgi:two-component system, LuxR family, sensor kinase FixL
MPLTLWTVSYGVAHGLAAIMAFGSQFDSVFWLPGGVALAAFVASEPHRWAAISLLLGIAGAIVLTLIGRRTAADFSSVAVDIIAGWLAASALSYRSSAGLRREAGVHIVAFAAAAGGVALAWSIAARLISGGPALSTFLSALAGALIAAVPLRALASGSVRFGSAGRWLEAAALSAVTAILLLSLARYSQESALLATNATLPMVAWAALRLGPAIALGLLGMFGTFLLSATLHQEHPALGGVLPFQIFLVASATTILLIGEILRQAQKNTIVLQLIEKFSPSAIITFSENGIIQSFNAAAQSLFGYSKQEIVGRAIDLVLPALNRPPELAPLAEDQFTQSLDDENRLTPAINKAGITFPAKLTTGEATIGTEIVRVGFIHDQSETEREQMRVHELQTDLLHASRLSEMGYVAADLAHEVSQPLAAIMNYAQAGQQMLRNELSADSPTRQIFEKIEFQARRASDVVKRLRTFLEKRETEHKSEDLASIVQEALALAQPGTLERELRTRIILSQECQTVMVDRVQILQVLVNLLRNALEAMHGLSNNQITINSVPEGPSFVEIGVADSGEGIPSSVEDRAFSPFVTTKSHGMGIGLSLSRTIVEAHGGRIWHTPNEFGGTTFHFTIPIANPSMAQDATAHSQETDHA